MCLHENNNKISSPIIGEEMRDGYSALVAGRSVCLSLGISSPVLMLDGFNC